MKVPTSNMVDALEDDLVKKFENEKKEKDNKLNKDGGPDNFMIFERHFEEGKEEEGPVKKEELSVNSGGQPNTETCSIEAEPF